MEHLRGSTQSSVTWSYLIVVAAFLGLCVLLGKDALPKLDHAGPQDWIFLTCLIIGGIALSYTYAALRGHFRGLERLRGDVLTMASRAHAVIPPDSADQGGAELKQIHQAVRNLADYISGTAALPDSHLESIVKAL